MITFEEARAQFEPLSEVYIGHAPDGRERLFIGEIVTGDRIDGYGSIGRRIPVKPRSVEELLEWIWTYPDELNRAMETELAEALGDTVEIVEWYPPTPEEREVISQ